MPKMKVKCLKILYTCESCWMIKIKANGPKTNEIKLQNATQFTESVGRWEFQRPM